MCVPHHRANLFGLCYPFRADGWVSYSSVSEKLSFFKDSKSHVNGNKFHAKNPGEYGPLRSAFYEANALPSALSAQTNKTFIIRLF